MFKYVFIALALFMSANAYAQDASPTNAVKRSLTLYTCGGTGNINTGSAADAGSSVLGSWYEGGFVVGQNFAKAQWLTIDLTVAIEGAVDGFVQDNNGNFVGAPPADTSLTGYAKVNLGLTKYVNVGVQTSGRLDMELKYSHGLPAGQAIGMSFYTELFPTGNPLYTIVDQNSGTVIPGDRTTRQVLNFMQFKVFYGIDFAKVWNFTTDLRFRLDGGVPAGSTGIRGDSLEAVRQSFNIRWNNTISYSNPNGLGVYVQLRYNAKRLTLANALPRHEVEIVSGIAYSFDLSAL